MKNHQVDTVAGLLVLFGLSAVAAQAAERTPQATVVAASEARALNPTQLTALRGISRNVLAAKKSGYEDGVDAAQLARLRASLDRLIAADLDPKNRAPITVQGQESGEQRTTRERVANLREAARVDASAVSSQLRLRGEIVSAQARGAPEQDTRSAGLPIGEQRARLFEGWAQRLDAALTNDNVDRTTDLRALRDQLRPTYGRLSDTPVMRGTPMLQAMPAGFVPPQAPNQVPPQADSAAKQSGR